MSAKHSAGPWSYESGDPFDHGKDGSENGFFIRLGEGRYVHEQIHYCADVYPEDGGYAVGEANARLIAASPTLYDFVVRKADQGDAEALQIVEAIHASR